MKNFLFSSKVFPGQTVNLMAGMKPDIRSPFTGTISEGFNEAANKVLDKISKKDCYFGPFPELIPCENWSQLVNSFFSRYKVKGRLDQFSGSAVLQRYCSHYSDTVKIVADWIGIDRKYTNDNSEYAFVLARVTRNMPNAVMSFSALELNSFKENLINDCNNKIMAFESDLERDISGNVLHTPGNIQKALMLMGKQLGSHYVASVEMGDEAYQVFVYKSDNYKLICDAMNKSGWKKDNALGFRYFTSKRYCEYTGSVRLLSEDPGFEEARKYLKDNLYNLNESVFNLVLNEQAQEIAQSLSSIVCVGAELIPITNFQSQSKNNFLKITSSSLISENSYYSGALLNSVTIQGCITRFGAEGAGPADITGNTNVNYSKLYAVFGQMDTLSMLWSPYLSISQMYISLDEVWKLPALNKTGVKHLLITADVIEIQEDIDLSTIDTVTFACRLLIAGKNGSVPTITLAGSSWEPLRLYCGSMQGSCVFEEKGNPNNHQLVFDSPAVSLIPSSDGVAFYDFFAGKFPVDPFYETGKDVDTLWRRTSLQSGLDALLMTSSIPLSPQAEMADDLRQTAIESWNCLKWISDSSRQVVDEAYKTGQELPEDLAWIYTHSVMLIRSTVDPRDTSAKLVPQVPPLRYTAYENVVNKLLDVVKEYSRQIYNTGKAIDEYNQEIQKNYVDSQRDENIKKIAKFMLEQNKALAEYEGDLTQVHNEIINKKQETILQLEQRELEITVKYKEYVDKLKDAKDAMVAAIKKKKAEELTKAIFEVVFGITEVFIGISTGVYSFKTLGDAKDAERTLKKLEAFMKFAEQANKIIEIGEKLAEHTENIISLDDCTPKEFSKPPTDMEWDIFLSDSEAHVKPAEEYIKEEVANYLAIVRDVAAVNKALNAVIEQKAQLQYDIWTENASKNVSKKQAERLNNLSINLNNQQWTPDNDYLSDLGQFNAVLRQKQNAALLKLAELVRLQDASMTYYYLSKPTIITQFDMVSIQEGLVAQALSAVQALETYPYPPTDLLEPLEIRVENVPVTKLTDDMGVEIQVQMNQGLFDTLAHVRINSLDIRIDGITTNTGKCHVQLETLGNPMLDRGLKREVLSYQMISREWHVVYDIQSGKTIIGTQPAKAWGQYFTKPTPFQTFRVSIPKTPENNGLSFNNQFTNVTLSFMLEAAYSKPPKRPKGLNSEHDINSISAADPSSFFSLLKGVSVTDGWDVVSFVAVDKINKLWEQRWENELETTFQGDRMFIQEINVTHSQQLPGTIHVEYHLNAKTGAPWIEFIADNDQSAIIKIPLIKGTMTTTVYNMDEKIGQNSVDIDTTVEKPVLIKSKAMLKKLQGEVDSNTVYIDPAQDAFALENIELDPQADVGICNEIVVYFKKQKLELWKIGTLRLNSDVDFLKPKTFNFKTYTPPETHSKDWPAILAIYILTTTKNPPVHGMRQTWPDAAWPVNADYDASVYFSSDLLWNNEIIPAVRQQISDADILKDGLKENYIQLKGSPIICNQGVRVKNGYEASGNYHYVTEYATVKFPFSAVTLKFNLSSLELACDTSWKERFPYQGRTPIPDMWNPDVSLSTAWDDITFSCKFDASSYPSIDPNNFNVTFSSFNVSPDVTEQHPSHSFLGLPLPQIMQSVANNAKTAITQKVSGFNLNLRTMPMFAVSNLLFPESKAIDPKYIYYTHDLVIVGNVVRDWKNPKA